MLPPFIIDQIRKREEEETSTGEPVPLHLPMPVPQRKEGAHPEDEAERGVIVIDLMS